MNALHTSQVAALRAALLQVADSEGEKISIEAERRSELALSWLDYLHAYHLTETADSLLAAARSSLREAVSCLSLGMIRPALFSLRSVIDLVLAWLYFKDHPVEWSLLNRTGDGFLMKKEVLEYLAIHITGCRQRLSMLKQIRGRNEEEPYRMLSAHIHGQSEMVLPVVKDLKDSVRPANEALAASAAFFEVAEYVSDLLTSVYAADWQALPSNVKTSITARFVSPEQRAQFWSY